MRDSQFRSAQVVRVIDGDTLVLNINVGFDIVLKDQHCRLLNTWCPEVRGKDKTKGFAAKKFVEGLVRGKVLAVQFPEYSKCSFKRWLVNVWVADAFGNGKSLSAEIIHAGHGLKHKPEK